MFKPICQAAIKYMSSSLILLSSKNFYTLSSFLLSHAYSQVITFRAIRTDFHWHLSPYSPPTLPSMFLNTVPQHVAQIIKHLMSTQRHFPISFLPSFLYYYLPSLLDYSCAIISLILNKNFSFLSFLNRNIVNLQYCASFRYSKVIQFYIYFRLFCIIGHYKILNIVSPTKQSKSGQRQILYDSTFTWNLKR